uniref:Uncharacterized protein n=1 Tax=Panagrolaimus davidi TaxID=227884 RepID=A0A914QSH7_9BILA
MFYFLLFILFVYFPVGLNAQNCSSNQINAVKTCYLTYLKGYGFDVIPTYNYYDNAEDKYRVRGWSGEVYICNAGTKLIQCIGSNNDGCVNVETMTKISGLTDDSPIQYVIDYRSMKYKCFGQGFTGNKKVM